MFKKLHYLDVLLIIALGVLTFLVYTNVSQFNYNWQWDSAWSFLVKYDESEGYSLGVMTSGLLVTLKIVFWSTIIALVVGGILGVSRISRILFLKLFSRTYVELIRNIPPLVFLFIFYFFISSQIMPLANIATWTQGLSATQKQWITIFFVKPELIENFVSGAICLALFEAAYIAEIVRAGLESIPKGQWEASSSLGMSWYRQVRHVILPQATMRVLPPLAGQVISLVKDSSILSIISIQELTFSTLELQVSTRRMFELWLMTAGLYFMVCFCFSILFRTLEKRKNSI